MLYTETNKLLNVNCDWKVKWVADYINASILHNFNRKLFSHRSSMEFKGLLLDHDMKETLFLSSSDNLLEREV